MKKIFTIAIVAVMPWSAFAQPVEEEITFDSPTYEIEVIESPSDISSSSTLSPLGSTTPSPVMQQPKQSIGEIKKPAPMVKEDPQGTWKFSPAVGVKAFGFDGGEKQTYGEIAPSASVSTDFITGSGKAIGFNAGYTLMWREFYDKSQGTDRYFEHDASTGFSMPISDRVTADLNLGFNYSVKANPNSRDFTIYSPDSLKFKFKASDQLSFNVGYAVDFFNFPDGAIFGSEFGVPSDMDDIRQGDLTFNDDLFGMPSGPDDIVLSSNSWFANNKAAIGASYAIPKGPSISAGYDLIFATFTNSDSADWRGHHLSVAISQSAWEGGSVSISNQLRLQNYQFTAIGSGGLKRAQRNRTNISVSQKITDQISVNAWYRLQMTSDNATEQWRSTHFWFLQANFSF